MGKVEDSFDNEMICTKFCGVCPTYPGIKGELLFCARGKSSSPKTEGRMQLRACDVWNKYDLVDFYYCHQGPAE